MKKTCKNCDHCKPTYKGGYCDQTGKKVRQQDEGCKKWREKTR